MTPFVLTVLVLASAPGGIKTGQLLGMQSDSSCSCPSGIFEIDSDSGFATLLFELDITPSEGALAVGPDGTVYAAFSGGIDELAIIDIENASYSLIGPSGFLDVSGLAFGVDGTLYAHDDWTCQLLTIDLRSGSGTVVGPVDLLGGSGLAAGPDGDLYACGAAVFQGEPVAALFIIDPELPATIPVGFLGLRSPGDPIGLCTSLELVGPNLYASASSEIGYSSLYSIDPSTGDATEIGFFDGDEGLYVMAGMAFLPGSGDVDRDGDVDLADYDIFVSCFTGPLDPGAEPLPVGCVFLDSDDDSDIDCLDWDAFIVNWTEDEEPPTFEKCDATGPCGGDPTCEGDANCDNTVDPLDAGFVQARFGCPVNTGDPECDAADVSVDGAVDPLDVGYVLARFGECE